MEKTNYIRKIVLCAMFLACGMVLPFVTGQIPQIGSMLLPMHIPVFLCGLICGGKYGAVVGFIMPLMRSAIFTMPPMFPDASAMAFELAAYGFIVGFMYENARWHCIKSLYRCMIAAMIGGRAVWGLAMAVFVGFGGIKRSVHSLVHQHNLRALTCKSERRGRSNAPRIIRARNQRNSIF